MSTSLVFWTKFSRTAKYKKCSMQLTIFYTHTGAFYAVSKLVSMDVKYFCLPERNNVCIKCISVNAALILNKARQIIVL